MIQHLVDNQVWGADTGCHLEGDSGGYDEGAVTDPLLKHEVVAAIPVSHAQPGLACFGILIGRQQVNVVRF